MEKFDFTTIWDRKGRDAIAVDIPDRLPNGPINMTEEGFDQIPMWIADMNFATAPSVVKAMEERLKHPIFGYFQTTYAYYDAIINWQKENNQVTDLLKANIGYENGVLGGLISALNVIASRGDRVLVHAPTYIGFTKSMENAGYTLVHSPLVKDEQGIWRMDFADMEQKIVNNHIHAAVFCSPHNPCGRVWEQWELEAVMELYKKHDVYVISDEIWSDLILPGYKHIPLQSVSEDAKQRTIALYAPSKTFNLAGLIGAYHVIYNQRLIDRVNKESSLCHYNDLNVLSMHALIGAYSSEGLAWKNELCEVLGENIDYAYDFIKDHFEGVWTAKPQGTYMLFLECGSYCSKHNLTIRELLERGWKVGVMWQDGTQFHGKDAIRMNLALPKSKVIEAFDRLNKYVFLP